MRGWQLLVAAAAVVVSTPLGAQRALRPVPVLRIRGEDHELALVPRIAVSASGILATSDIAENRLRFFDANGRETTRFGRRGEGPGEFLNLSIRNWIADTIVTVDAPQMRSSFVSRDGKLVRTVLWHRRLHPPAGVNAAAIPLPLIMPSAFLREGGQLLRLFRPGDEAFPAWIDSRVGDGLGNPVAHVDRDGRLVRVVAVVPRAPGCTSGDRVTVAFCARPMAAYSPSGSRVAVTVPQPAARGFSLVVVNGMNGDTVYARHLERQAVPVSREVLDSIRGRRNVVIGASGEVSTRQGSTAATVYPPVLRVVVSDDGIVWLEVPTRERATREWLVLDTQGGTIGTVRIPAHVNVHLVARDGFWAIEPDPDGWEDVVRYRLEGGR